MKLSKSAWIGALMCGVVLWIVPHADGANVKSKSNPHSQLNIRRDSTTGKVIVSWKGRGILKKATTWNGDFKPVYRGVGEYIVEPAGDVELFKLESENVSNNYSNVYSHNIVGYVTVLLRPGLSLIANPLYLSNGTLRSIIVTNGWTMPPDGCQVFKYAAESSYEVSTFDRLSGTWSNPNLDMGIGTGFYFSNPSSIIVTQTFVGEVLEGVLVNPLPAGLSTKGALVPQAGSVNDVHGIPGDAGDEIRTYVNDWQGGGYYCVSVFDGATQRWQPDLTLQVAEGFWINKQRAQDWVRVFYIQ